MTRPSPSRRGIGGLNGAFPRDSSTDDHLTDNAADIVPRDPIVAHDHFCDRIVQQFVQRWFISGSQ
jgi:hypothetical protein